MSADPPHDRFDELPFAYAAALRLARAGASDAMIAEAVGIEPAGVPALMHLARAKLAALDAVQDQGGTADTR